MALTKSGYKDARRGTTRVPVGIDSNGNIAVEGDTVVGTKSLSITAANAENSLVSNTALFSIFVGLAGGSQDSLNNKMTVTWEADS